MVLKALYSQHAWKKSRKCKCAAEARCTKVYCSNVMFFFSAGDKKARVQPVRRSCGFLGIRDGASPSEKHCHEDRPSHRQG